MHPLSHIFYALALPSRSDALSSPMPRPLVASNVRDTNVSSVSLLQALHSAGSTGQRLAVLLPDPSDASNINYTFKKRTVLQITVGSIVFDAIDQWPALALTNVAMPIGFVNPCGLNTPHSHLRGNEYSTVIRSTLYAGFILKETWDLRHNSRQGSSAYPYTNAGQCDIEQVSGHSSSTEMFIGSSIQPASRQFSPQLLTTTT